MRIEKQLVIEFLKKEESNYHEIESTVEVVYKDGEAIKTRFAKGISLTISNDVVIELDGEEDDASINDIYPGQIYMCLRGEGLIGEDKEYQKGKLITEMLYIAKSVMKSQLRDFEWYDRVTILDTFGSYLS